MRILTVVQDLGAGGTQRVAETCAIGYQSLGARSAVLAYGGPGPRAERLQASRIPLFIGGSDDESRRNAVDLGVSWRPDVVHIHRTGYSERVSGEIVTRLSSPSRKVMETNVFARFDSSAAGSLIDVHVLLSSWCLWKYQRWARAGAPPLAVVVPNPVEVERFYPSSESERRQIRREWNIPDDGVVFGRVGQPIAAKWSPAIFRAFGQVGGADGRAYLVLAGMPDSLMPSLQRLPKDIRDRVRLLPFRFGDIELRRIYGGLDVFLHAAKIGESFGMVLCEAMLAGLPVITLATPLKDNSQTEVVKHGVTGLVCYGKKWVAQAMTLLLDDATLRRRMGWQGREYVQTHFDSDMVVKKLLVVADALGRAGDRSAIRRELESLHILPTVIDRRTLDTEFGQGLGKLGWGTRIARDVIHIPQVYAAWRRIKRGSK